jgi:hypothetical protein
VAQFALTIKASVQARNLSSANTKLERAKELIKRAGFDWCEIHLDGPQTSTKERA